MFVDEVKVFARAGHGGKGCVAFLREAYRPKGGPDGGNGGRGGDVILEADHDLNNLIHQFYQPRLIAQNGDHGMGKGMDGHAGKDLLVKVPCGTLVWRCAADDTVPPPGGRRAGVEPDVDAPASGASGSGPASKAKTGPSAPAERETPGLLKAAASDRPVIRHAGGIRALEVNLEEAGEDTPIMDGDRELVADLTEHGQRFVLCKGGRGGLGNRNFANSVRQTPRFAQPGEPGTEGDYILELRMIADVGLVGFPNAGKSTLLSAISKARPKIAAYPFTTLTPQIGIVECGQYRRLVVCDVPGLIEGAHRNVGLGHAFLRHIARCKVLVVVLDMAGTDGRTPWDDYRQLLVELELYDRSLLERRRLVVANKMDETVAAENLRKFKRRVSKTPLIQMAAGFGEGIDTFKHAILEAVEEASKP